MGIKTEFIDDGNGVLHTGTGIVQGREIIDGVSSVLEAAKRGMPLRYSITDLSNITKVEITSNEIRDIAHINIQTSHIISRRTLVVIVASSLHYGLARMWEVYAEPTNWNTRVFRDANEAKAWLNTSVDSS